MVNRESSVTPSRSITPVVETRRPDTMAEGYISIGEALKLIPPFMGNKSEVTAYIGNVDTAFSVINPNQKDWLYKFVLTRISGEPRMAVIH
jgi:hypothetical protein